VKSCEVFTDASAIQETKDLLDFLIETICARFDVRNVPSEKTNSDTTDVSYDSIAATKEALIISENVTIESNLKLETDSSNPFVDDVIRNIEVVPASSSPSNPTVSTSNPFDEDTFDIADSLNHSSPTIATARSTPKLKSKSFIIRSSSPMIATSVPINNNSNSSEQSQSKYSTVSSSTSEISASSNPAPVCYPKKLFSSRASTYIPHPSQYLVTSINDFSQNDFNILPDNTKK